MLIPSARSAAPLGSRYGAQGCSTPRAKGGGSQPWVSGLRVPSALPENSLAPGASTLGCFPSREKETYSHWDWLQSVLSKMDFSARLLLIFPWQVLSSVVMPHFFRICKIFFVLFWKEMLKGEYPIEVPRRPLVWTKRTPVPEAPKLTCVPQKETFPVSCPDRSVGNHRARQ